MITLTKLKLTEQDKKLGIIECKELRYSHNNFTQYMLCRIYKDGRYELSTCAAGVDIN